MRITAANVALLVTVANALQHYARAAKAYFADPTPEAKEAALRKGALYHGHIRRLTGPRVVGYVPRHPHSGIGYKTAEEAEQGLAALRQSCPRSFAESVIVKVAEVPE